MGLVGLLGGEYGGLLGVEVDWGEGSVVGLVGRGVVEDGDDVGVVEVLRVEDIDMGGGERVIVGVGMVWVVGLGG